MDGKGNQVPGAAQRDARDMAACKGLKPKQNGGFADVPKAKITQVAKFSQGSRNPCKAAKAGI